MKRLEKILRNPPKKKLAIRCSYHGHIFRIPKKTIDYNLWQKQIRTATNDNKWFKLLNWMEYLQKLGLANELNFEWLQEKMQTIEREPGK